MINPKKIIEQIRRYASPPPAPPAGYVSPGVLPAPAASPAPPNLPPPPAPPIGTGLTTEEPIPPTPASSNAPQNAPSVTTSLPVVAKMQTELVELAKSVIQQVGTSALSGQIGAATPDQTQAASRTSFADFFTKHYVRQSDVPAVEFDPNPAKKQMAEKDPSRPTRLNVVMDTMKRIGGHDNEFVVDGRWGPKTNAALHNAYAIAYGLLEMSHDFNYTPQTYTPQNLAELKQMIPADEKTIKPLDKIQLAKQITPHLRGIRGLFQEVKNHILSKPAYRSYIEGDDAFTTYKKQDLLTPQDLASIKQLFPNGFTVSTGQGQAAKLNVDDIVSLDTLNKAIADKQLKMDPYNILSQISNQVGQVRSN